MEHFGQPPHCPYPVDECVKIILETERMKRIQDGILAAQLEVLKFGLKLPFREGSD
jgi:hypothetical protein